MNPYTVEVSADGNAWMVATGCDDGFSTQDKAEDAMNACEQSDPGFRFRTVRTAFGRYWHEVYGDRSASQLCREYGLTDGDLVEWVTHAEVFAAQQCDVQHWKALQAEWNALGFSANALKLLQGAKEAIHQAATAVAS
jgi:hypothetical protein